LLVLVHLALLVLGHLALLGHIAVLGPVGAILFAILFTIHCRVIDTVTITHTIPIEVPLATLNLRALRRGRSALAVASLGDGRSGCKGKCSCDENANSRLGFHASSPVEYVHLRERCGRTVVDELQSVFLPTNLLRRA
jgi:hypothetical protein